MSKRFAVLACLCAWLVGCGSSQSVVKAMEPAAVEIPTKFRIDGVADQSGKAIPSHFLASVRGNLESELTKRNLLAAEAHAGSRVRIEVTSYRMRSGITRGMFGMFAGKDGIGSKVTVIAPNDDRVLGESTVSTFNVMAIGSEEDIARMHAGEIAKFLAGEKIDDKK